MRTLALLAALLLLALQAQAQTLPGNAQEDPDQEQLGKDDQVATISFLGNEESAEGAGGRAGVVCYCRIACGLLELTRGYCRINGIFYRLCCH